MKKKIPSVLQTSSRCLDLYDSFAYATYLNYSNSITAKNIVTIKRLLNSNLFVVPSFIEKKAWGFEKIFYPFTNKLFKVLHTTDGQTSLQLHPLKSEMLIALNEETVVCDDKNEFRLGFFQKTVISRNTIHSMKQGAIAFEEQDNVLFDDDETIRIEDYHNRKINCEKEYYKLLLPSLKNKIKIKNVDVSFSHLNSKNDRFLFLATGTVTLESDGEKILLDRKNELYFIGKGITILEINGIVYASKCVYYKMEV